MKLKTLLSVFVFCISFAFTSFGQDKYATAISSDDFKTENFTGTYTFTLPAEITAEDVQLSAEFYTVYFKVNFNDETNLVSLIMNGSDEKNRQVIARFFISLGLRDIEYKGKIYPIQDFYTSYIKGGNSRK